MITEARKFKFTKYGLAEDPRGAQVTWTVGDRTYLADVVGCYVHPVRGVTILKTRHFNGEEGPEVAAGYVNVIGWSGAALHRSAHV